MTTTKLEVTDATTGAEKVGRGALAAAPVSDVDAVPYPARVVVMVAVEDEPLVSDDTVTRPEELIETVPPDVAEPVHV